MIARTTPRLRTLSPYLKHGLVLGLILLFGAVLRFRHLNWARGYYFQPDESVFVVDYALRLPASLNPYEAGPYAYGGLPVYLYYFSARALSRITSDPIWMDKWHVTLVARTYAATASTITIALIYTLWHRLGTARVGWISALALAVSPLSIQYAHYGVVDTLLTFWVVLTTLLSVEAWMRNHPAYWAVAGLALGLAVATKSSGLVWALVFVVAALGYWARTHHWRAGLHVLALGCIGALIGVLLVLQRDFARSGPLGALQGLVGGCLERPNPALKPDFGIVMSKSRCSTRFPLLCAGLAGVSPGYDRAEC